MSFRAKLLAAQAKNNSILCVGLEPMLLNLPIEAIHRWDDPMLPFCKAIVNASADLVCAYKPNLAYFMQWGAAGLVALERIIAYIPSHIPVILDCKAAYSGAALSALAAGAFDEWGVDALTVSDASVAAELKRSRPSQGAIIVLNGNEALPTGWAVDNDDIDVLISTTTLSPALLSTLQTASTPFGSLTLSISQQIIAASQGLSFATDARKAAQTIRQQLQAI